MTSHWFPAPCHADFMHISVYEAFPLAATMFTHPSSGDLAAAVEADPSLQQRMAVLLLRSLRAVACGPSAVPRTVIAAPEDVMSDSLSFAQRVVAAFGAPAMQPGVHRQLRASGEDVAAVLQAAFQLLAQAMCLAGGRMGRSAAQTAQQPCSPLAAVQPGQPQPDAHEATSMMVDIVQVCRMLLSALTQGSRAAHMAALRALPLVAAIVQELVPPAAHAVAQPATAAVQWQHSSLQRRKAAACWTLGLAVDPLLHAAAELHISSSDELLQCCAATDAALCMLAVTAQLATDSRRQPGTGATAGAAAELAALQDFLRAAQRTSYECFQFWEAANCSIWVHVRGSIQPAQPTGLEQPVLQLHSRACRLVHRLCGLPSKPLAQALGQPADSVWSCLLDRLSFTFVCVNDLLVAERRCMAPGSTEHFRSR